MRVCVCVCQTNAGIIEIAGDDGRRRAVDSVSFVEEEGGGDGEPLVVNDAQLIHFELYFDPNPRISTRCGGLSGIHSVPLNDRVTVHVYGRT